ncbi:MAG: ABC transporter ATP-binding protein [Acidobacteriota bacterium]|jgi:putative spermidine/putrescine transport system ATP-binding protein
MAFLEIERLTKRFGDLTVLDELSLDVAEGEVLAFLGPSGSGKTTFLRLLAGFETADGGAIRAAGREVTRLPPAGRGFGMVFQHYALFPHLTVADNVAFGLEARKVARGRIRERVGEVLALVDLEGFGERPIGALSGGQQQRVALARALAPDPPLLLLDEPLSNLDPTLRERTRRELLAAIRRVGITTVLVTHEQDEAFHLGDRVAVLWNGRLQQVGAPEELYLEPRNRFVASFIGRSSVLPGRVVGGAGSAPGADARCRVRLELGPQWEGVPRGDRPEDDAVLVVRPESLRLAPEGGGDTLTGRVIGRRYGGPVTYYQVEVPFEAGEPGRSVEVEVLADAPVDRSSIRSSIESGPEEGDTVHVALRPDGPAPSVFPAGPDAPGNRAPGLDPSGRERS